jgi:hypothetical protein
MVRRTCVTVVRNRTDTETPSVTVKTCKKKGLIRFLDKERSEHER